jgi:hypothetical protein
VHEPCDPSLAKYGWLPCIAGLSIRSSAADQAAPSEVISSRDNITMHAEADSHKSQGRRKGPKANHEVEQCLPISHHVNRLPAIRSKSRSTTDSSISDPADCPTTILYAPQWFNEASYPLCGFPLPVSTVNISTCCSSGYETIDSCFHYCQPAQQLTKRKEESTVILNQFSSCVKSLTKEVLPANATQPNGFMCNEAASNGAGSGVAPMMRVVVAVVCLQALVGVWL